VRKARRAGRARGAKPCLGLFDQRALGELTNTMQDADLQAISQRLSQLREEHRDLDAAIEALATSGARDQIQIQRLKKRKLLLRDQIRMIEDGQLPNIIA
jgi:hypothetical protein